MSWTQSQSGTTSALTIGTETQLGVDDTNNATFCTDIDTSNLALGDSLLIKVYKKVLTGGSLRLVWEQSISNVAVTPGEVTPPLSSLFAYRVTLTQTAGTGRTFDWSINRI